jgi:hypothetical protein
LICSKPCLHPFNVRALTYRLPRPVTTRPKCRRRRDFARAHGHAIASAAFRPPGVAKAKSRAVSFSRMRRAGLPHAAPDAARNVSATTLVRLPLLPFRAARRGTSRGWCSLGAPPPKPASLSTVVRRSNLSRFEHVRRSRYLPGSAFSTSDPISCFDFPLVPDFSCSRSRQHAYFLPPPVA